MNPNEHFGKYNVVHDRMKNLKKVVKSIAKHDNLYNAKVVLSIPFFLLVSYFYTVLFRVMVFIYFCLKF